MNNKSEICPQCGSGDLVDARVMINSKRFITGQNSGGRTFICKECGYEGPFWLEINKKDLTEVSKALKKENKLHPNRLNTKYKMLSENKKIYIFFIIGLFLYILLEVFYPQLFFLKIIYFFILFNSLFILLYFDMKNRKK